MRNLPSDTSSSLCALNRFGIGHTQVDMLLTLLTVAHSFIICRYQLVPRFWANKSKERRTVANSYFCFHWSVPNYCDHRAESRRFIAHEVGGSRETLSLGTTPWDACFYLF